MLGNALGGRGHLYKNTETLTPTSHVVMCSYTNIYRIISVNAHLIGWYVKLSVTPVQVGICRRTGRAPLLHSRWHWSWGLSSRWDWHGVEGLQVTETQMCVCESQDGIRTVKLLLFLKFPWALRAGHCLSWVKSDPINCDEIFYWCCMYNCKFRLGFTLAIDDISKMSDISSSSLLWSGMVV